jgi:hypothetical protein
MSYEINEIYEFKVQELYQDPRNEQHYLRLIDEEGNTFRVKPFRYHIEWAGDIDKVNCVCCGLTPKPWFRLRKLDLLEKFYQIGEAYPFVVREKCYEDNGTLYYIIEDNILEIKQRYYTKEEHAVGDLFSLTVRSIDENSYKDAYLSFEPENESENNPAANILVTDIDVIEGIEEARAKVGGAEGQCVEWKSSIAFVAGQINPDIDRQMSVILKIIASFQNSKGGTLYIGVNDNGLISGINQDFQYLNTGTDVTELGYTYNTTLDSYQLKIHNAVRERLGTLSNSNIDINFAQEGELYYCIVKVEPTRRPVYLDGTILYQRAGNMCQRLKGDDLTNFILDRERQYSEYGVVTTSVPQVEYIKKEQEAQPLHVATSEVPELQVKFYMQFYKNGQWSYSDRESEADDIKVQVPIYKETLKEALLLCYSNGCVNRIRPYDFLNPKRTNGRRRWMDKGKRYENGFNSNAELLAVYSCFNSDYLAVLSTDQADDEYAKVHSLSAVSVRASIHAKGNQFIPTGTTTNVSFALIPSAKYHFVSALAVKDYQTTSSQGFRRKNIQLSSTFDALDQLIKS